jgi:hypothetical protein
LPPDDGDGASMSGSWRLVQDVELTRYFGSGSQPVRPRIGVDLAFFTGGREMAARRRAIYVIRSSILKGLAQGSVGGGRHFWDERSTIRPI